MRCSACCEQEEYLETIQVSALPEASSEIEKASSESLSESAKKHGNILIADDELVRGISIHATLHGGGCLWQKSPCDMSEAEKVSLWEKSRRVDELDMFLSHAWASSGKVKFLALLLYTGSGYSFLFWATALMSACGLCAFEVLPMPFVLSLDTLEFSGNCPLGVWMLLAANQPSGFLVPLRWSTCQGSERVPSLPPTWHQTEGPLKRKSFFQGCVSGR